MKSSDVGVSLVTIGLWFVTFDNPRAGLPGFSKNLKFTILGLLMRGSISRKGTDKAVVMGVSVLVVVLPFGTTWVWTGLGGPLSSKLPRAVVFQAGQQLMAQFLVFATSVR